MPHFRTWDDIYYDYDSTEPGVAGGGGTGVDFLIGGSGNDFGPMGSGDDLLIVNNGDGSDFIESSDQFVFDLDRETAGSETRNAEDGDDDDGIDIILWDIIDGATDAAADRFVDHDHGVAPDDYANDTVDLPIDDFLF